MMIDAMNTRIKTHKRSSNHLLSRQRFFGVALAFRKIKKCDANAAARVLRYASLYVTDSCLLRPTGQSYFNLRHPSSHKMIDDFLPIHSIILSVCLYFNNRFSDFFLYYRLPYAI